MYVAHNICVSEFHFWTSVTSHLLGWGGLFIQQFSKMCACTIFLLGNVVKQPFLNVDLRLGLKTFPSLSPTASFKRKITEFNENRLIFVHRY